MAAGHDVLVHQDHGGTLPGMGSIELSVDVAADARTTWAVLADVGHHHRWMEDAFSIRFEGEQRQGEGTVFFADTRVGPLRTTDRMIITAWTDEREMSVRHEGAVTGEGTFTLEPRADGGTRVLWRERLNFPWWFAGRLGEVVAKPILSWVWRRNLTNLARLVDAGPAE